LAGFRASDETVLIEHVAGVAGNETILLTFQEVRN
jgi:hypothetical protein